MSPRLGPPLHGPSRRVYVAEPRTSTSGTRSIPALPATGPNHTVGMGIRGGSLESRFMTQEWRLLRGGDLWDVVQVATCLAEGAGTIIRGYFARLPLP